MIEEIPVRTLPTIIAAACVREAVRRGQIQSCSGRAQDERKRIERRIAEITGFELRHAWQGFIDFQVWRSPNRVNVWIETELGVFEHAIGENDARDFIAGVGRYSARAAA